MIRKVAVLGATGSIGTQTLDIIERYPDRFSACVLTAITDAEGLFKLARKFKPKVCAMCKEPESIPDDLKHIEWFFGKDSTVAALDASEADDAVCAIVGVAGLDAVLKALDTCSRVLLANKEALVTGGELVVQKAKRLNRKLRPVDSEHSAIYQCLTAARGNAPERLILTCSGGALRTFTKEQIKNARVSDVLKHPTWRMGAKITVDCASLVNKGLEVIEAHYLFDMPADKIDVVIHPQSVIHSMVEFSDGAVLAQLGSPDMRSPIGYALGEPDRLSFGGKRLNFSELGALTFEKPDYERFPCLKLAYEAISAGGSAPKTLNGANEEADAAFLRGEKEIRQIYDAIVNSLEKAEQRAITCAKDVYDCDRRARELARRALQISDN